jgi:serine phosphatase RsbU (regulator of sigma subunit)
MRTTFPLRIAAFALSLGAAAAIAIGQEPAPARMGTSLLDAGDTIQLARAWRFHAGDDPHWADPNLDDANWQILEPRMPPGSLPAGGWSGTGWFRRHLEVDQALWGTPLALRVVEVGCSEIYLDGKLVARFGPATAGDWQAPTRADLRPATVIFSTGRGHVLAVRLTLPEPSSYSRLGLDLGFVLSLEEIPSALTERQASALRRTVLQVALTVVPLFLALLHLGLFGFYPKARENLFYALYMLGFAVIVFSAAGGLGLLSSAGAQLLGRLSIVAAVAVILFGLFTYYALRTLVFPRSWVAFALLAPVPAAIGVLYQGEVAGWCWVPYFAATVAEIVRVEVSRTTVKREGSRTLLWVLLVIYGAVAVQALINVGVMPSIEGSRQVYVIAILAAAVSMSLFLARSFARTRLHLERRLEEVQALSGQILEQERAAHENELRARVLEVENARKSAELEAARALQLSMLPPELPTVAGLEVAVAMATATEVGGDYYDFRLGPDGSLLVAVGDATGHGVAAGIMVTAVKALFTALNGEESLTDVLRGCNRVLRGMNLAPLRMCLGIARVTPRSIAMCSAAMPPLLVWRAQTGEVEELGVGGLPLGGGLARGYEEQRVSLGPGDTVLFTTDGFPELLDPGGATLGFDGAARALQEAAGAPAAEVVARLTATAAAWRRDREQADDITFVVVRVNN